MLFGKLKFHPRESLPEQQVPLVHWVWRSYFKTSLIPLLMFEIALVSLYFISTEISNRENIQTVKEIAEQDVIQLARREAVGINRQLEGVARATDFLRRRTGQVMAQHNGFYHDDPARFAYSRNGAYYTTRDNGGSAVFYSGYVPIGPEQREKAIRSAGLDPVFKGLKESFPLVVQVYYNTFDSLNRIYPYFDVLEQYPDRMDIPSYNFYYEADLKHNPQRKVVWTDVYADPAGQGWMTSCIAPVYTGDFLEGVVGLDVTVGSIIKEVLDLDIPWQGYGLLVSRQGTIIALPKVGESDWGLKEFTEHHYSKAIMQDTFKPAAFNVFKNGRDRSLSSVLQNREEGMRHVNLGGKRIVAWATIPETGWKLLVTVPEDKVYAPAHSLSSRLNFIAWLMLGGMLAFYIVFFSLLYRRARQMSEFVSRPLERIDGMVKRVAAGDFVQDAPVFNVDELSRTAQGIVQMGARIDAASQSRARVEEALKERTRQLQSVFDLSPDGFIAVNSDSEIMLVNPAFCRITGTEASDWLGLKESRFWRKLTCFARQPITYPAEERHSFRIELERPRPRVLQCEIRDVEELQQGTRNKVVYFHDVTKSEELERMKGQFLATAAHELRTPLTSVMGYAELLKSDLLPSELQAEAYDVILSQSRLLVRIINELLELARIEGKGSMDFDIQSYEAQSLASAVVNEYPVPSGRSGVLAHLLPEVKIYVDAEKFKGVLNNVIDNAYMYSAGGDVTLDMMVDTGSGYNRIGFAIGDTGIGMTEEEVSHVFDRFWRADNSGHLPGSGLGMSIADEVVRLMAGEIEIESTLGIGTTVTIWLPEDVSAESRLESDE